MKQNEFSIGLEFYTASGKWRCTDTGSRVIVAIKLNQEDKRNYLGPPYSICECVFDEDDIKGCFLKSDIVDEYIDTSIKNDKIDDLHSAFMFVSSSSYGESSAIYDRKTGAIYFCSDVAGIDEFKKNCESEYDEGVHIEIPHKNDLDLGRSLVFEFIRKFSPKDENEISLIFHRKGAYSKFKDFLNSKDMLQKWYDFENSREQEELENWCRENNINIS